MQQGTRLVVESGGGATANVTADQGCTPPVLHSLAASLCWWRRLHPLWGSYLEVAMGSTVSGLLVAVAAILHKPDTHTSASASPNRINTS